MLTLSDMSDLLPQIAGGIVGVVMVVAGLLVGSAFLWLGGREGVPDDDR